MSDKELAIRKVVLTDKSTLLHCTDKKNQESTRVILYHLKRKMLNKTEAETIGITKFSYNGELFIKLFKRPIQKLYELDENGVPVLVEVDPMEDKDLQRQIMLMRKDGVDEKEIQEVISLAVASSKNLGVHVKDEKTGNIVPVHEKKIK